MVQNLWHVSYRCAIQTSSSGSFFFFPPTSWNCRALLFSTVPFLIYLSTIVFSRSLFIAGRLHDFNIVHYERPRFFSAETNYSAVISLGQTFACLEECIGFFETRLIPDRGLKIYHLGTNPNTIV